MFISDFRYLNKCLVRRPYYLIPKIADVLQKLEGIHYATSLDLNMGYYTVWLDPDSQKLCTIHRKENEWIKMINYVDDALYFASEDPLKTNHFWYF